MKEYFVTFASKKLETAFDALQKTDYADKELHRAIERIIQKLKKNPEHGTKIAKELWPKTYAVTNLWKVNLPNGWRIIYTIKSDDVQIVSIILEWFDHKAYEKRFHY